MHFSVDQIVSMREFNTKKYFDSICKRKLCKLYARVFLECITFSAKITNCAENVSVWILPKIDFTG